MKTVIIQILGLGLLLGWQPQFLRAQEATNCHDALFLYDGSRYRGQLEEIRSGDTLVFRLWTGLALVLPQAKVKRIVQHCRDGKTMRQPYSFKETGWYNHTRLGTLIGQEYTGQNSTGFQLEHSSGWMFSRSLGVGIGLGIDFFSPGGNDAATYPVFAEARTYLLPKKITPYFTLGGGWAFAGHNSGDRWGYVDSWRGGWLAQAEAGYRIGNHFSVHFGLRLQHKVREWTSVWGPESNQGTDRILNKRLVLGIGLLL